MSETGYHMIVEADDDRDDAKAAEIGNILREAFPGHPWHVRIGKGVIIIKHMKVSSQMGMCRHYDRIGFDAKVFKREIEWAAAEFLERAGLARGKAIDGDVVKGLDGAEERRLLLPSQRVLH